MNCHHVCKLSRDIQLAGSDKIKEERHTLARRLNDNYWKLDKYVRARTYYDRTGMIGADGKINFYPPSADKQGTDIQATPPVQKTETTADDVD